MKDWQYGDEGDDYFGEVGFLDVVDVQETIEGLSFLSLEIFLTAPKQGSENIWHTFIFQTTIHCRNEAHKLIIDGDSNMNVVSKATVVRLNLPTEPHPRQ